MLRLLIFVLVIAATLAIVSTYCAQPLQKLYARFVARVNKNTKQKEDASDGTKL